MANLTINPVKVRPLDGCKTRTYVTDEATQRGRVVQPVSVGTTTVYGDDVPIAEQANATQASGEKGQLGLVVDGAYHNIAGTVQADEPMTVVLNGPVYLGEDVAMVINTLYFVATTDGLITDTKPTHGRAIGYAITDTILFFDPTPDKDYI